MISGCWVCQTHPAGPSSTGSTDRAGIGEGRRDVAIRILGNPRDARAEVAESVNLDAGAGLARRHPALARRGDRDRVAPRGELGGDRLDGGVRPADHRRVRIAHQEDAVPTRHGALPTGLAEHGFLADTRPVS